MKEEGFCIKCGSEFSATFEKLICPVCSNWVDITDSKIEEYKNTVRNMLVELNDISFNFSQYQIFRIVIDLIEATAKDLLYQILDLKTSLSLLERWVCYSTYLSTIVKKQKEPDGSFYIIDDRINEFLIKLQKYQKSLILLLRLFNGSFRIYRSDDKNVEIVTPPNRPLFETPLEILKQQNENAGFDFDSKYDKMMQTFHSFIDVNFFYTHFLGVLGTYLSHGLGLPRYLMTNDKITALKLTKINNTLLKKLEKMSESKISVLTSKKFISFYGKKMLESINPFLNTGRFALNDEISWLPNIFIEDKTNQITEIYTLFYSNYFINEILKIKTGKTPKGDAAAARGKSFEDELFGYCETINVTGFLKDKKLLRVKNPIVSSRVEELSDIIFIGNKTKITYIISAKTHIVLKHSSLIKELRKYHREQSEIIAGLKMLNIGVEKISWIFLTPTTWISSYKNIDIYNTNQLTRMLYRKEGKKKIDPQSEDETYKLEDFKKNGEFIFNNRRFCIEICKICDIQKDELAVWISKREIRFALLIIDLPNFIDISHLMIGKWIKILFEIRTKYSTQFVSYHDAKIIDDNDAFEYLIKQEIYPPYP